VGAGTGSALLVRGREMPAMPPPTPLDRAKAVALRHLAAAPRTESQVRARLARAELGSEADEVVRWLAGLGYLDDAAYASARARALLSTGRAGPRLAERRLEAAGIAGPAAREAVTAALAEAAASGLGEADAALAEAAGSGPGEAEAALCRALAERRAGTKDLGALDDRTRSRLSRFLLGRGFSGEAVARALGAYEDR
jgi:regulatory protein